MQSAWLQGSVPCAKGLCVNIRFCYGSIWQQISFLSRWLFWHPDMSCLHQSQIKLQYQLDWTFTKERVPEGKRIGTWYARQAANTLVLFLCIILCYSIIMCDWSLRDYTSLSVHSTQNKLKIVTLRTLWNLGLLMQQQINKNRKNHL